MKIASAPDMSHYSKAILIFMPGMAEIRRLNDEILLEPAFPVQGKLFAFYFLEFSTMLQTMSTHCSMPRTPVSREMS